MKLKLRSPQFVRNILLASGVLFAMCTAIISVSHVYAATNDEAQAETDRLITLYDRGVEQVFATDATTVRAALEGVGIVLDERDTVEPGLDEELVAKQYSVNIYRARPIIVVDDSVRQRIVTSAQTPEKIADDAGIQLYDEDGTTMRQSTDILADGAAIEMVIDRATPFAVDLYGEKLTLRTQARTVEEFLAEKNITLGEADRASLPLDTVISKKTSLRIWREGTQTKTVKEKVAFATETINDADRDIGYSQIRRAGVVGERSVTYEITIQNGKEVARKELASVTLKKPQAELKVVGTKQPTLPYTGGGSKSDWLASSGIAQSQWGYVDWLVQKESGWNPNAVNASSGACGLGQQLPCGKWAGAWNDPVAALQGMNGYVVGRYGSWANAVAHSRANGWY